MPDEVLPAIGRFFPRFELVDVDAGHWVISENPEGFREGELTYLHSLLPIFGFLCRVVDYFSRKLTSAAFMLTAVVRFLQPKE